MKKILLTGGSGFIGRHSIPFLLDKGYEVHAVFHKKEPDFIKTNSFFWHPCNLLNIPEQKKLMAEIKPSHLLHLAWYAVPGIYWDSLENFRWVQASIELMMNFAEQGGLRVVAAGTSAEYDWSYGYCSEKLTPCHPSTLYGTCKNSVYEMLCQFSNQMGLSYSWGRVFFLYGPFEYPERLISSIICSLLKNQEAYCLNGSLIRDFLHVEDVASVFVSLLESDVTGPINIASGNPVAIKDVVYTIADHLGKRDFLQFRHEEAMPKEPRLVVAQTDRLKNEVGWLPAYNLERGIEQTIAWWKEHLESRVFEKRLKR